MLYIRMFIILVVSLFTVRLLLKILGVVDYGVYNVIGSLVSLFAFLSYTLSIATQRFLSIEIANNNTTKLHQLFNLFIRLYSILALILGMLAEIVGLWLLHYKLNIPPERFFAAKIVLHTSITAFMFTIQTVPFQAMIIAQERMNLFAFISILEASLKLLIVFFLYVTNTDKLIMYGLLVLVSSILITGIYFFTVVYAFKTPIFAYWNKTLFKTIIGFSGWNLFGSLASVLNTHGVNLLINIFFGPIFNAARAIAVQANTIVNQFVTNFTTAVNPQITKLYALGDRENMQTLVYKSSKFSFFLILLLAVPLLFESETILDFWLGHTPALTNLFLKLIVINTLIDSLSYSFQTAVQATGNVRNYQVIVGSLMLMNLPISYVFFKTGFSVEYCFYIGIAISIICLFVRLFMLKQLLNFSPSKYWSQYMVRYFIIILFIAFLYIMRNTLCNSISFLALVFCEIVFTAFLVTLFGLTLGEKRYLIDKFRLLYTKYF